MADYWRWSDRIEGDGAMANDKAAAWLRCFRPAPEAGRRLICFPHAGGAASYYFKLAVALHPEVEVLVVQYPGREDRLFEEPAQGMDELVDGLISVLPPWTGVRPSFFGHSMGALVAFETARRLQRTPGAGPLSVIASGSRPPSRPEGERLHLGGDQEILAAIGLLGGTDGRLNADPELLALVLPAIRADMRIVETYQASPDATLDCPINVFVGDQDPRVAVDEARGWSAHTTAGSTFEVFDGDHFYLTAQLEKFAERLTAALAAES
jgi:pyochelin biosynthetic protein PchC